MTRVIEFDSFVSRHTRFSLIDTELLFPLGERASIANRMTWVNERRRKGGEELIYFTRIIVDRSFHVSKKISK